MLAKIKFNSPVILIFVFMSFISLLLDNISQGLSNRLLFCVYPSSPGNILTYIRLFTHILGHADWSHYINNILLILVVGPLLEEKYGSYNILIIILITALVSGIFSIILFPNVMLLGASGVVFAFILLSSITSFEQGSIPLTFILVFIVYIGGQVVEAIFVRDNISNSTHIIGGVIGSIYGYYINSKNKRYKL